ncbi:MAG: hypothetical protein J5787_01270 [Alphaproteobacteria bacterium]|nr:hypothetical protein [Alphaproteobacteria bacterium]
MGKTNAAYLLSRSKSFKNLFPAEKPCFQDAVVDEYLNDGTRFLWKESSKKTENRIKPENRGLKGPEIVKPASFSDQELVAAAALTAKAYAASRHFSIEKPRSRKNTKNEKSFKERLTDIREQGKTNENHTVLPYVKDILLTDYLEGASYYTANNEHNGAPVDKDFQALEIKAPSSEAETLRHVSPQEANPLVSAVNKAFDLYAAAKQTDTGNSASSRQDMMSQLQDIKKVNNTENMLKNMTAIQSKLKESGR